MEIKLIQGEFNSNDALELITKIMNVKIVYHENKVANNSSEEDIKYRESKIKKLQNELFNLKNDINEKKGNFKIDATIKIEK